MSVFRSDPDLEARDVTGTEAEADVALNLVTGNIRLSILWTQEIQLSADDAEQVAKALQRAAAESRSMAKAEAPGATEDQPGLPAT
ncbi:hypothetical protein ACH41C_11195 [Streptomyces althioticus]|uniref:hypothetical protein n=1 Tax=Streptomyces althioticus TaxID=83380 RepID=UPI0033FB4AA9